MASTRTDALKNREHLLGVARTMVREGEATPSFNALAARAEVGVGTVYRHFADQHALLSALAEVQLAEFDALFAKAEAEEDAFEALSIVLRGAVELELDNPVAAEVLSAPKSKATAQVKKRLQQLELASQAIVLRARKAKVIRGDVEAADFRRLACGIFLAAKSGEAPRQAAKRYVEIVLAGLRS